MMGPEVSLLAIFLLLVNIWTPTVQAIPPKKFLHPHSTSGLHGGRFWTDAIETIAREAENPPDPESATWYRWFFRPDVNTYEKRVQSLRQHEDLLGALQDAERSHRTVTPPTHLPPSVQARLQMELDVNLLVCIEDAIENSGADFPTSVKQCEEEYTVHLGDEEMKGRLGADTSQTEWLLTSAYKRCRAEHNTKQYCRYQTTAVVDGKTLKAASKFLSETQPPQKVGRDNLINQLIRIPQQLFNHKAPVGRPASGPRFGGLRRMPGH